jgi:hypothetical protein
MFSYFNSIYGLVTKHDPTSENAGLFLAQYVMTNPDALALSTYYSKMKAAKQPNGMYARSAKHLQRSVSHDEISAMMSISYKYNSFHRFEIWKSLIKNYGAYPAIVMDKSDYLPYNLANYYAWGQYVGSKLSYLFLPLYFINMVISSNKKASETSSKLITHLELSTMPKNFVNKLMFKYFEKKMIKQYGTNYLLELRKIYFWTESEDFPLFKNLLK